MSRRWTRSLRPPPEQRARDLAAARAGGLAEDDGIVYLPAWLIRSRVSGEALFVASLILTFLDDDDDVCRRPRAELAEAGRRSASDIERAAQELEAAGLLDRDSPDGPWRLHPGHVIPIPRWIDDEAGP